MRVVERGVVTEVLSNYSVKVRLVDVHKVAGVTGSTPDAELPASIISNQPGIHPVYQTGDTVIVGFESKGYAEPVILGLLHSAKQSKSRSNAYLTELTASGTVTLSEDTSIGKVTKSNIKCLEGLDDNVDKKFSELDEKDEYLDKKIIDEMNARIAADDALKAEDVRINQRIDTTNNELKTVKKDLNDHTSDVRARADETGQAYPNKIYTDFHVLGYDRGLWEWAAEYLRGLSYAKEGYNKFQTPPDDKSIVSEDLPFSTYEGLAKTLQKIVSTGFVYGHKQHLYYGLDPVPVSTESTRYQEGDIYIQLLSDEGEEL